MANRVAESQRYSCWDPSWAHLGPVLALCWGILGPNWVQVGLSWAHLGPCWGHVGALLEGPGRHPEADSGLRGTVFEPTCGNEATCQKLQKPLKNNGFPIIFVGTGLRGSVLSWFVRGKGVRMQRDKGYRRKEIDLSRKPKQFHNPNGFCQPTLLLKSWSTVRFVR